MWSATRQINYGLPPEMGMVGVRDVFVVAPASSFHPQQTESVVSADPHSLGVGVGVIPLLAATPCLAPANVGVGVGIEDESNSNNNNLLTMGSNRGRTASGGIQLWQNQPSNYNLNKPISVSFDHGNSQGILHGGGGGGGLSASSTVTTCQDCGNQAKKDCTHRRCRTCCKSRGFDCATHLKSTWVPAARRRERQLLGAAAVAGGGGAGSSGSTSASKKPRLLTSQTTTTSHTSTSNTTPPRSFDTSSSHQDGSFKEPLPGQVRAPAVFKCVRVTAVDGGEDEFAYQAVVKIGGHVFKGFLYAQGNETRDAFPNISELHLGGNSNSYLGGRNVASSSSPILDPSDVYATSGGGGGGLLGGGSNYGSHFSGASGFILGKINALHHF
ncbi:hypothetical protein RJ641_007255 [Dillenia turbinata]|uniref:Uncharacterized protein n=1 Tax=Dillenia turbinata TaxID=194707 RepID=A0AAN8V8N4_9MAGN